MIDYSVEDKIRILLLCLGIPVHYKGYHYLQMAIRILLKNPTHTENQVYNLIREHYAERNIGNVKKRIECAMRKAKQRKSKTFQQMLQAYSYEEEEILNDFQFIQAATWWLEHYDLTVCSEVDLFHHFTEFDYEWYYKKEIRQLC